MAKVVGYIDIESGKDTVDSQRFDIEDWAKDNGHTVRTFRGVLKSAVCAANRGELIVSCRALGPEHSETIKAAKNSKRLTFAVVD